MAAGNVLEPGALATGLPPSPRAERGLGGEVGTSLTPPLTPPRPRGGGNTDQWLKEMSL